MFTKTVDPFIDLRKKCDDAIPEMPSDKKPDPRGPILSIYDSPAELPLTDKDMDKQITADVRLKPRMARKIVENGKISYSYEIEVMAIRFTS